jgi:hypothetical protein
MSIDIDRPVSPAPPPWFDGWPPLWEECIFQNDGQDYVVMPIAYYDGSVVFAAGDDYPFDTYDGCSRLESFRPIRTQAQREREELISAATEMLNQDHVLTERDAAETLYDAGMLRRAGE